jgi:hypothetical protein
MYQKIFSAFAILTLCTISNVSAQTALPNAIFINANVGGYFAILPLKESTPRSNVTHGGGIGVQLSNRFVAGGKVAYYSHTGIPLVHYYDSNENGHLTYDGVSTYRQWIYLIFLHYKMMNEEYVMASVGGGVMFSKMSETESSTKYDYYTEGHANDIKGGFISGELELRIPGQPFSAVSDVQFGFSSGEISSGGDTDTESFAGFNTSVGIRYYFLF